MKVTIVSCESGEWDCLYIDETLIAEGHSIHNDEIVAAILSRISIESFYEKIEITDEAMEGLEARFPAEWPVINEQDIIYHETLSYNSETN